MLCVEKLSFSYRTARGQRPVFEDLDLTFQRGMNVILGPNGAGKSTLLKCIFGLLDCKGQVSYGERNITKMGIEEKIKMMSYLPQMDIDTSSLTVLEMVLLGRLPDLGRKVSDEDFQKVMETLAALNITDLASRSFSELSGGQKKLVFIAQTLVRQPEIIMLDEPVNSLDLQKQLELCQLLQRIEQEQQIDILVVLHDINLAARYAKHIVVMDETGRHYSSGKPSEVITPQMLEEVYGVIGEVNYDQMGIPVISPLCSVRQA